MRRPEYRAERKAIIRVACERPYGRPAARKAKSHDAEPTCGEARAAAPAPSPACGCGHVADRADVRRGVGGDLPAATRPGRESGPGDRARPLHRDRRGAATFDIG